MQGYTRISSAPHISDPTATIYIAHSQSWPHTQDPMAHDKPYHDRPWSLHRSIDGKDHRNQKRYPRPISTVDRGVNGPGFPPSPPAVCARRRGRAPPPNPAGWHRPAYRWPNSTLNAPKHCAAKREIGESILTKHRCPSSASHGRVRFDGAERSPATNPSAPLGRPRSRMPYPASTSPGGARERHKTLCPDQSQAHQNNHGDDTLSLSDDGARNGECARVWSERVPWPHWFYSPQGRSAELADSAWPWRRATRLGGCGRRWTTNSAQSRWLVGFSFLLKQTSLEAGKSAGPQRTSRFHRLGCSREEGDPGQSGPTVSDEAGACVWLHGAGFLHFFLFKFKLLFVFNYFKSKWVTNSNLFWISKSSLYATTSIIPEWCKLLFYLFR
jgi:hypothetical protein